MFNNAPFTARQLAGQQATTTYAANEGWCTPLILPVGGVIIYGDNQTTTLSAQVTFRQPCNNPNPIISPDTTGNSSVIGYQFPFYASISPQIFALATATVISYVLVILIFITPRTFVGSYGGGGGGSGRFLSRRGIISSSSAIVGVGRRPLLQKIAAITVAISLTIATADTFSVAEKQYRQGYMDSSILSDDVVNSLEIRVIRVISDTFLWLAQVQTLIRLFPRHREKVTIKWLGFAMVTCDTVFSILDSIVSDDTLQRQGERVQREGARGFRDAIPALNYLFELAISLIYASCVLYYSMSKRRFAYYHPRMKNICLVALVSIISVLIPVVFFVLDIAKPVVAGWGEYIRWVGAAAASVVVWEWVERIEALERDERKDGILGREIFDADEMLDMSPSEEGDWAGRQGRGGGGRGDGEKSTTFGDVVTTFRKARARLPVRKRRRAQPTEVTTIGVNNTVTTTGTGQATNRLSIPHPAVTPPSRSDTTSAASTVYAIRYHNLTSPSPAIPEGIAEPEPETPSAEDEQPKQTSEPDSASTAVEKDNVPHKPEETQVSAPHNLLNNRQKWQTMPNPFKRRRAEPPAEVAGAQIASGMRRSPIDRTINFKDRLGAFATSQKDRFARKGSVDPTQLPIMVIPAPRMNERTWSPDDVRNNSTSTADSTASDLYGAGDDSSPSPADNVVIIPAPSPGRTWSPGDAITSAATDPTQPNRNSTPSTVRTTLSPQQSTGAQEVTNTPRGSLIISENNPRFGSNANNTTPTGARRLTNTRPVSISPISERLGMESPANRRNSNTAARISTNSAQVHNTTSTQNLEQQSRRESATTTRQDTAAVAAVAPARQTESSSPTTATESLAAAATSSAGDSRDTGGGDGGGGVETSKPNT